MTKRTSFDALVWARSQTVGSASAKSVLNMLAEYADKMTWECFPSIARLVDNTELKERAVRGALTYLDKHKFIEKVRQRRGDGSYRANLYRINPTGEQVIVVSKPAVEVNEDGDLVEEQDENTHRQNMPEGSYGDQEEPPDVVDQNDHRQNMPTAGNAGYPAPDAGLEELPLELPSSPLPPKVAKGDASLPETGQASPELESPPADSIEPIELQRLKSALLERLGEKKFKSWCADLEIVSIIHPTSSSDDRFDCSLVTLSTNGTAKCAMIEQRYLPYIKDAWNRMNGGSVKIIIQARAYVPAPTCSQDVAQNHSKRKKRSPRGSRRNVA